MGTNAVKSFFDTWKTWGSIVHFSSNCRNLFVFSKLFFIINKKILKITITLRQNYNKFIFLWALTPVWFKRAKCKFLEYSLVFRHKHNGSIFCSILLFHKHFSKCWFNGITFQVYPFRVSRQICSVFPLKWSKIGWEQLVCENQEQIVEQEWYWTTWHLRNEIRGVY